MQAPPNIEFRDIPRTRELEELISKHIAKLEQVCNYITRLSIVIESGSRRYQSGNPYRVRLDVRVPPGHELVGKRVSLTGTKSEPLPAVIHQVFDKAERQLEKLVDEQHKRVKSHPTTQTSAFVTKLFPEGGYGFITSVDGENIYFHRNSVLHNHWDRLAVGTGVRYSAEVGEKGLQATTVELVDKPGAVELHGELHAI
jgi:cold shock CspA family protein/ribosome-associated translation inhibitor RaiA